MVWKKNRELHPGEMEFHMTGWRQAGWDPDVLDHPATEMERRREDAMRS